MQILNYLHDDTIAVGVVNPKTTALFYDKIWVPASLIYNGNDKEGYNQIPLEVRILEDDEVRIYKEGPYQNYNHARYRNIGYISAEQRYRYSKHRNNAILIAVKYFKKYYNLDMTPFFFEYTDFEKAFLGLTSDDKSKEQQQKIDVIKFTVKNISTIVEDSLSWSQVLEIRNDVSSRKKLRRFKNWCNYDLNNKSIDEVCEILTQSYDDYRAVLKKYGIQTKIGSFTTLLSTMSTLVNMINADTMENISTGIALSAALITYTSNKAIEYFDFKNRKEPIAYVYDIVNKNKSNKNEVFISSFLPRDEILQKIELNRKKR